MKAESGEDDAGRLEEISSTGADSRREKMERRRGFLGLVGI